jgi:hypothetical protein
VFLVRVSKYDAEHRDDGRFREKYCDYCGARTRRRLIGVTGTGPFWVTATGWPAIVSVTERTVPVFGAIAYDNSPGPDWMAVVAVIHAGIADAVQEQPAAVATESELERPAAGMVRVAGVTV